MRSYYSILLLLFFVGILQAQTIELELLQNGFNSPVNLQNAGDQRLFVVEQGGRIKIMQPDGTVNSELFLDISSQISSGGERGLLGLAFHPDYDTNGFFYVNYTDLNGDTQISRFTVSSTDPDIADPLSELMILDIDQPFSNHNGGCLAFGPDGYLYIATGDGGSGGDPGNRAQNTTLLLGKLLRIDVDNPGGGNNYGIPADNPFAGSAVNAEEIWAYGLRNPWKFSFDSDNGDLWIADVGQGDVEEINKAGLTEAGLNYGWRCYEGSAPFNTAGCPDPSLLEFPEAEYSSSSSTPNCSVTGGYVYRGSNSDINGLYFFADVCSGLIGTVDPTGTLNDLGTFGGAWVAFGEDEEKNLFIVDIGGAIYRIVSPIIGVEESELKNNLSLYPNPAHEFVTIKSDVSVIDKISILTIKGSEVYTMKNVNATSLQLNLKSLSTGLYVIQVIAESGEKVYKKLLVN